MSYVVLVRTNTGATAIVGTAQGEGFRTKNYATLVANRIMTRKPEYEVMVFPIERYDW